MKPTLLIIDDEPGSLELMVEICQQGMPALNIITAPDGATGLELARSHKPGVVLLDVLLPDTNGFDVCRALKSDPATASMHVLMVSGAMVETTHRMRGIEFGADGYLLKPFDPPELLLQVQSLFRWWKLETGIRENLENQVAQRTAALEAANNSLKLEIAERQRVESERERLIIELQTALAEVKTLRGLIPICAHCKKIRDDKNLWHQIESYIQKHSDARFSHSICPDCVRKLYPDLILSDDTLASDI